MNPEIQNSLIDRADAIAEKRTGDALLEEDKIAEREARLDAREHALTTVHDMLDDEGLLPQPGERKKSTRIFSKTIPLGELPGEDRPSDMKHGFARIYLEYTGNNSNIDPKDVATDDKFFMHRLKEYGVAFYVGPEAPDEVAQLTHLEDRKDRLLNPVGKANGEALDPTANIYTLDSLISELQVHSTEVPAVLTAAGPGQVAVPMTGTAGPGGAEAGGGVGGAPGAGE